MVGFAEEILDAIVYGAFNCAWIISEIAGILLERYVTADSIADVQGAKYEAHVSPGARLVRAFSLLENTVGTATTKLAMPKITVFWENCILNGKMVLMIELIKSGCQI